MTTVNHFVNDCPNFHVLPSFLHRSPLEVRVQVLHLGLIISTLEIALANITQWTFFIFCCVCVPSL